jgi:hypothetical protein
MWPESSDARDARETQRKRKDSERTRERLKVLPGLCMPPNTCSAYNNNNNKKEEKEEKKRGGRRSIESQSGAEESPAKSLSLLGSGLPKKTSRGMKPKKHTSVCVLCVCRALPLNGDAVSIMTSI